MLASLNHPNIAAIYGFEEADGIHALVLELVEGPTLADVIAGHQSPEAEGQRDRGKARGSLEPLRSANALSNSAGGGAPARVGNVRAARQLEMTEAFAIARQIADALEAAHEAGVMHRDLKPANIKVRPDGTVKVLDFGLAKALDPVAQGFGPANATNSPTMTSPAMTGMGVILGTAAYMSPEQAKGKPVDKRSDIWAFGCVLYEMLTGQRAFAGEDVSDTLAFIITKEPDWTALPANTPWTIRKLLRRCLEKDRKRRLRDIGDARMEIEELPAIDAVTGAPLANADVRGAGWSRALPWTVAVGALAVAMAVVALWAPWRNVPAPPAPVRLEATLGADASLVTDQGAAAVLSPDGAVLAFVAQKGTSAKSQVYVRRLDQLQATPLAGTDGARNPFFSPDGQWIAFFADAKLKKILVTGGAAVMLCDAVNGRGGNWADDGTIAFSPSSGGGTSVWRVSSAGGKPEPVTTVVEGDANHRWPQVLPAGKAVLYTTQGVQLGFDAASIVVQPLPNGPRKILLRGGYFYGRYLPSGHLVYMHESTLFAAPFDLNRLELAGPPVPVVDGVTVNRLTGAQFAVADNGALVYFQGQGADEVEAPISWMDRQGRVTSLRAMLANWTNPLFAPDGRQLAMDIDDGRQTDVWVYHWMRDTLSRLTLDPARDEEPVWTPDGRRIVFGSSRAVNNVLNLYWQRADGTGEVQRLTDSKNTQYPSSWHPSGKFLAFQELNRQTNVDLMILPMEGDEASGWKPGKPTVFLNSPFNEREPMFSPDGRWLAYCSNESGRFEVYVRPFPGPGGKWQISTGGGANPTWSRTRHELFYGTPDQRIMVVPYTVEGDSFRAEKPRLWSEGRYSARTSRPSALRSFDLHPDGDRFALAAAPDTQTAAKQDKLVFIFNFFDELRRIAPVAKR